MNDIDEDNILSQLAAAWFNLAVVGASLFTDVARSCCCSTAYSHCTMDDHDHCPAVNEERRKLVDDFWATICKTVRPVLWDCCLSCLSVTLVYCGQTVGWIRIPLGTEVGLGPSGVASIGPMSQVGPGQARFGCFHDCCLSENNYFDQLNFTFDCHDYIA